MTDYRRHFYGSDYKSKHDYYYKPIGKSSISYHHDDYWGYDWNSWRYFPSWRSYYKYFMDDSIPTYKIRSYSPSLRFWHHVDDSAIYTSKLGTSKYTNPSIRYKYNLALL